MSEYVLGPEAVVDLEDIWDYIATGSIDAADRWIAKLFDAFDCPHAGHRPPARGSQEYPILFWTAGAYSIIYRARRGEPVEIVAVTQGSRDIPAFLRRRLN